MDVLFGSVTALGGVLYLGFIVLWISIPVFIFLISRRVREMRDLALESRLELKELNASIKYLKRKFSEQQGINQD